MTCRAQWRLVFLSVAMVLFASTAAPLASQDALADAREAVLLPGDGISITVFRREEMSGTFRINGDSTIAHPLYKVLKVGGIPMDSVNERVTAFLTRYEANPQVLVEPLFRVVVAGEVNAPDLYEFGTGITVARAISLAGGVRETGNPSRVRLIRGVERIPIDLRSPDPRNARITVRSGDQVVVLKRVNYITDIILPAGGIALALNQLYVGLRAIID